MRLAVLGTLHRPPGQLSLSLLPVSCSPALWPAWQHCPLLEQHSHHALHEIKWPRTMARDMAGEKKGFATKSPLEPALVWLQCQGSPSLISALTQGFDIKQTALPCICYVTLGTLHLPELQNREKVTFLGGLW